MLCGVQVLHPWRRIFQQMFNHDRMAGPLYCMWDPDLSTNHPVVTQLGARCRAATDDYAAWQALLINTLDMQVSLAVLFTVSQTKCQLPPVSAAARFCLYAAEK